MHWRRFVFLILFVLLVAAVGYSAREFRDWDWILENEAAMSGWVERYPLRSWCVGLVLYFLLSLVPGSAGKSVVFGWLFGFWRALAIVELGLTLAATMSFLGARYAVGSLQERRIPPALVRFRSRFAQQGGTYLLMLRLAHVPFTLVNYGSGITHVPLKTFVWTTFVGILPGSAVFVFTGTRIPSLRVIAEQGVWALIDFPLLVAMVLTSMLPLLLRILTRRMAVEMHIPPPGFGVEELEKSPPQELR